MLFYNILIFAHDSSVGIQFAIDDTLYNTLEHFFNKTWLHDPQCSGS